jgi:hypothetical protein
MRQQFTGKRILISFQQRGKMIILALTVFTVSASAIAAEATDPSRPVKVSMVCTKSSQKISGLTKICYYDCAGSEGAITVQTYEACPRWKPRWRLNRTGPFGPSEKSR